MCVFSAASSSNSGVHPAPSSASGLDFGRFLMKKISEIEKRKNEESESAQKCEMIVLKKKDIIPVNHKSAENEISFEELESTYRKKVISGFSQNNLQKPNSMDAPLSLSFLCRLFGITPVSGEICASSNEQPSGQILPSASYRKKKMKDLEEHIYKKIIFSKIDDIDILIELAKFVFFNFRKKNPSTGKKISRFYFYYYQKKKFDRFCCRT